MGGNALCKLSPAVSLTLSFWSSYFPGSEVQQCTFCAGTSYPRIFAVTIIPTSVVFFCVSVMCADICRVKYLIKVNLGYNTKCEVVSDLVNPERYISWRHEEQTKFVDTPEGPIEIPIFLSYSQIYSVLDAFAPEGCNYCNWDCLN